jgi:putative FmdB family regulatory protein
MPTYDYRCGSCEARYELRESFSAPSSHTCEKCGKGTAKRVLTAPRIVFKGSGWYVTDSRNKSSATADSGPSDSTSDKSEKKATKAASSPAKPAKSEGGESAASAAN